MDIRIHFRYREEVWSLYNKTFNIGMGILLLLCLIGHAAGGYPPTSKYVFVVLGIVYMLFILRTLKIWLKRKNIMRCSRKYRGFIVNMIISEGTRRTTDEAFKNYQYYSLLVEYVDPNTGQIKQFETPAVNGDPFFYLSSLEVTVYVQPDGNAWATDFKWLKSLKDSWSRNNKELAEKIKPIRRRD